MIQKNTPRARNLRHNQTEAEKRLWRYLRNRQISGAKFRRQVPKGPYVVDFLCAAARLIVELDGGQHADQLEADERRTVFLQSAGYRVVRFWNNEVLQNMEGVLTVIEEALQKAPHPTPLPKGERE